MNRTELENIVKETRARGESANLYGADLRRANLQSADLQSADLRRADLQSANLYGADLRRANLQSADLQSADLRRANLQSADLYGADLYGANLQSANLYGADLQSANLRSADLRSANLSQAKGLLDPIEFIEKHFECNDEGFYAFKTFRDFKAPPEGWQIEKGSIITETVNPERTQDCGSGVNIATASWVLRETCNEPWRVFVPWRLSSGVIVPFGSGGKIRAARVQLVEQISRQQLQELAAKELERAEKRRAEEANAVPAGVSTD